MVMEIFEPCGEKTNILHVQKHADQLCSNGKAVQGICFRYMFKTTFTVPTSSHMAVWFHPYGKMHGDKKARENILNMITSFSLIMWTMWSKKDRTNTNFKTTFPVPTSMWQHVRANIFMEKYMVTRRQEKIF